MLSELAARVVEELRRLADNGLGAASGSADPHPSGVARNVPDVDRNVPDAVRRSRLEVIGSGQAVDYNPGGA
ncbi:MAG: hypothetical protein IH960_06735 [Chloroflexi bacterium]|nr:hypothetical protein [Chloroflexota bacterium]